jgi:PEP-CTERM motif-containing protein
MRQSVFYSVGVALLALSSTAHAATIRFDSDPFAGTTALTTPGRQIIANELFTTFNIATDVFSLESTIFGTGPDVHFVNATAPNVPATGVNVVVLQTFDDDNNPLTNFAAGNAANLIAAQITTPGPGFFIYFNQGLDVARLVFSTDLNDNQADLKVLARMTNLSGQTGRDAIPTFTAENFQFTTVPEPASLSLMAVAGLVGAGRRYVRRGR